MSKKEYISTDNLDLLLNVLPPQLREALPLINHTESLIEIVLDLGRLPEARYPDRAVYINQAPITHDDINYVASRVGNFTRDNRAGIERTLHRISAIRNRLGEIVGLTCRVGRAIFGTVDIIRDVVESGNSILLMGKPGVGKTTLLREAARVLADDAEKRVIVVDTSNEIAGDGDVPHPGIGRARRMQVPDPDHQHGVMIEAVENHMPEVIVIDEIGTSQEALAARTIAERGVQLIATVHGNTLENLMLNPTLSDLVGGIHSVTLSDDEARRRRTQKTVLERKAPPTFDVLIEIQHKDTLTIHQDVTRAVDQMLRGFAPAIEIRERREDGEFTITQPERAPGKTGDRGQVGDLRPLAFHRTENNGDGKRKTLRIFPFALSRERLSRAIEQLGVSATIARDIDEADILLTLKSHAKRQSQKLREARGRNIEVHVVRSNTVTQIENFLRGVFGLGGHSEANEDVALQEVEDAVLEAIENRRIVELAPQPNHIRRKQHLYVERSGLTSKSKGQEPLRYIVVYPL